MSTPYSVNYLLQFLALSSNSPIIGRQESKVDVQSYMSYFVTMSYALRLLWFNIDLSMAKINNHLETAKKKEEKKGQMTLASPAPQSKELMQYATLQHPDSYIISACDTFPCPHHYGFSESYRHLSVASDSWSRSPCWCNHILSSHLGW